MSTFEQTASVGDATLGFSLAQKRPARSRKQGAGELVRVGGLVEVATSIPPASRIPGGIGCQVEMPFFKALIENSSDIIALIDPTGKLTYVSALGVKALGYQPNELVGRNIYELIHREDHEDSRRALLQVLSEQTPRRQVELRLRQKNGDWCWMQSTISNLLDDIDVTAIVINFRERAERGSVGKQLPRANEELEHFAYAVAHDLREPLATISMFTELLLRGSQPDEKRRRLGQFITDGVIHMDALLSGLRSLVLPDQENRSAAVNLDHVVERALENLQHALSTNKATVIVDPLPWIKGDERQLMSVVQNLIGNAIKYRRDVPLEIRLSAEGQGADWTIRVKDNGLGIAPAHRELVFGQFKRLHGPEIPGAGLGLALCKKIIQASGHTIWVESEPGDGSSFCFTASAAEEPADARRSNERLRSGINLMSDPVLSLAAEMEGIARA